MFTTIAPRLAGIGNEVKGKMAVYSAESGPHVLAGAEELADVTADMINDRNQAEALWERLIISLTAADLFAGNRDMTATDRGLDRATDKEDGADEYYRRAWAAVADLKTFAPGNTRADVPRNFVAGFTTGLMAKDLRTAGDFAFDKLTRGKEIQALRQKMLAEHDKSSRRMTQAMLDKLVQEAQQNSLWVTIATLVVTAAYSVPQVALYGRTLGKRVMGLRVLPSIGSGSVTWRQSTLRWVIQGAGWLICSLLLVIDLLWPLWDRPLRQAIHDKAAQTIVARDRC